MSSRFAIRFLMTLSALILAAPGFSQEAAPWVTRFTGKHVFNGGVGHDRGFSSLEWFLPLEQDTVDEMWFGDFRGIMFDDAEFGGNLGMGYRWHDAGQDRIYGFNGYWDFRNQTGLLFNQAGIGVESLGRIFDFRANGYTPTVNDADQRLPFSFIGNNLLNTEYRALSGFDYELAVNLPDIREFQSRIAGGGYYFDASKTAAAAGWRARFEIAFRDTISAAVAVQDDKVYGQTLNVTVEYRYAAEHLDSLARRSMHHKFRDGSGTGDGRSIRHRLADPVFRQQNIVLLQHKSLVVDTTSTPLTFLHVVEGGAGDGTFEMPYGSIGTAMADSLAPTSIVYTPQGGTFSENVSLVDGTRLLSNGPQQFVDSSLGSIQLPFSGTGADLTALPSTIVGDLTVANNTEVSGFEVSMGGIKGTGVSNVNINQTSVTTAPGDAITFTGSDAVVLQTMSITSPVGRGILLDDTAATVSNVTVMNSGNDGLQIDSAVSDRVVSLTNLNITNAGDEGIDVNVGGIIGNLTLNAASTTITSTNNAIDVVTTGAGEALVSLSQTTLSSTAGAGLNVDGSAGTGTLFVSSLSNTIVTEAATGGLLFDTVTFDANPDTGTIQTVSSTATTVGTSGSRINGAGVSLTDVSGNWNAGVLNVFNQNGTALFADNSALGTPATIATAAGSVLNASSGPALELDTINSSLVFDSITSTISPTRGIDLINVTGNLTGTTTTLSESTQPSIRYKDIASPLTVNLGRTTINSTISDVEADNIVKDNVPGLTDPVYTPLTINGP